ncbi:MAG: TSUP family transporter [Clostridiales bacterium]|nr:TSUP family transporter [Candidatus Blautia equi]
MMTYLIVCPMVFLAGFIDAIAGGGGLISLPAFMFAGLPVHNAIATNKMSSTMGTSLATFKLAKGGFIPWKQVLFSIIGAVIGSSFGARCALLVDDYYFKITMLVVLPLVAAYVLFGKGMQKEYEPYPLKKTMLLSTVIALVVGVYDGFYGPGTGTFLLLLLTTVAHVSLKHANGHTKAINLTTNISALSVYLVSGKVLLPLGIIAGCFNIAGNYLGITLFTTKGTKIVRPFMLVVLTIFFIKVLTEVL